MSEGQRGSDVEATFAQEVPPPWQLEGSAVAFLDNWRSARILVHYTQSPVGAYDELAVATVTLHGPTVTEMIVTSAASVSGGRQNWGFPKTLGALRWEQAGRRMTFRAESKVYRVRVGKSGFPVRLNAWCWQELAGRRVRVPFHIAGTARIGWRGRQIALVLEQFKLDVLPPE